MSSEDVKVIKKKMADGELRLTHFKASDGSSKNAVLYNDGEVELLVILDEREAKQELENMAMEFLDEHGSDSEEEDDEDEQE